jgi:uncharacterized membrane protein (UPF0127 family)
MPQVLIQNSTRPLPRQIKSKYCSSVISKFLGLMMQSSIKPDDGILLVEKKDSRVDSSIHMLFMRFEIAAVWINSNLDVVDVRIARKWQLALVPVEPAIYVLETHPSQASNFKIGDRVNITHV